MKNPTRSIPARTAVACRRPRAVPSRPITILGLVPLCLSLLLTACTGLPERDSALEARIAAVLKAHPELACSEARVLDIVQKNPGPLIESVRLYKAQLQENQDKAAAAALQQKINALDLRQLVGDSPTRGANQRRVLLVEFSDFECPFCGKAYATVRQFMAKHGDEVTLVYKHLPLVQIHPLALPAARAAWAAHQQGKFWDFHDSLFEDQAHLGERLKVSHGNSFGLDAARFAKDAESPEAIAAIQKDVDLANELGLGGTPFFLLEHVPLSGAVSLEEFEAALRSIQGGAPGPPSKATAHAE